jgi:hypothetical protein
MPRACAQPRVALRKSLDAFRRIAAKRPSIETDSIRVVAIEPQASAKLLLARFSSLPA